MTASTELNPFITYPAEKVTRRVGEQWLFRFGNGYSVSVLRGPHSYGGPAGLWELAVLGTGGTTVEPDGVVGWLGAAVTRDLLHGIAALPPKDTT